MSRPCFDQLCTFRGILSGNNGVCFPVRGKCIILREKSDIVVSIAPTTSSGLKHSSIPYHIIPLGTNQEPKGISLNTAIGSDRIEVGDAAKAEVIYLQFSGEFALRQLRADQGKHF